MLLEILWQILWETLWQILQEILWEILRLCGAVITICKTKWFVRVRLCMCGKISRVFEAVLIFWVHTVVHTTPVIHMAS